MEKKFSYRDIVIEVTRRCNMCCAHCMRGDAEKTDIPCEYIEKFFGHVKSVDCITFTGGEPTLNLDAIEHTLNIVKKNGICVNSFYLVTNGKEVSDRFLHLMIDWTVYCLSCDPYCMSEDEMGGIALSQDMYHEEIPLINRIRLKSLSVFRPNDKKVDFRLRNPIALGRARHLQNTVDPFQFDLSVEDNEIEGNVTLTAKGDILSDCDYEFSNTDKIKIGSVDDITDLLEFYKKEAVA